MIVHTSFLTRYLLGKGCKEKHKNSLIRADVGVQIENLQIKKIYT
jgi:hypothetical protein